MKTNELKCKNCGATLIVPEGTYRVVCDYCNSSYDIEDAYSSAYKYHKGMLDASSEKFEKQFKMVNDALIMTQCLRSQKQFLLLFL